MGKASKVTSVSFVWNRTGWRVRNHLFSLANQSAGEPSERIVVDFSTDPDCAKSNKILCEEFNCIFIYCSIETWCKPLAMNVGIKRATGKYIILTDIDQVFHKNFLANVLPELTEKTYSNVRSWMTPKEFLAIAKKNPFENWNRIISLCHEKGRFNKSGIPIHIFPREWLCKVHGMNEDYIQWGLMDNDLSARGAWSKLVHMSVFQDATFHQYHKRVKRGHSYRANRKIYNKVRAERRLIVNPEGWGNIESYLQRNCKVQKGVK